ncbi:MAG TPA: hypothetical protein DHU55_01605 [Blastocatellia bacterium]|nr:hypothetical protein [Blastocatellia bacterium]
MPGHKLERLNTKRGAVATGWPRLNLEKEKQLFAGGAGRRPQLAAGAQLFLHAGSCIKMNTLYS